MNIGLYYSTRLNILMVGRFIDWGLRGRVISNSIDDYFSTSFMVGYSYDCWDRSEFTYLGTYRTFTTLNGYLAFLDRASYEDIKAYFKLYKYIIKRINK